VNDGSGRPAQFRRLPIDLATYGRRSREDPCFICRIVARDPGKVHHLVYEDERAIAFLNKYPTLYGYTLVAPRDHREQIAGEFSVDEYLALQRVIHRVGEAIRSEVPTERLYVASLGSQQGNRHVHWHLAPLPPGVPYAQQQLDALDMRLGVLDVPDDDMAGLAARLRRRLASGAG